VLREIQDQGDNQVTNFTVRRGRRYRATLTLGVIEQLAGNGLIAAKLREAGFDEVEVTGSGEERTAVAVWAQEDTSAALPSQVSAITEIEQA
jgi:hypothetical protein